MATIPNQPKPQQGWGVGYLDNNVGGGFNQFNNYDALGTEIERINTVMGNRTQQGLGNDAQQNYLNQLNAYYQPYQQQQQNINNAQQGYQDSQARQDANRWNNATIQDIAAKYGFDYSKDYAKQQAEAEAQALRNANLDAQRRNVSNKETGLASIDANLMNQAEAMDRNYFQQMMAQQQNQVNSGLNAGIASDQDLRLQMARQAEMGASHRDANLGRMKINENFNLDDLRLAEAMGLIDQQALAREDSLYNSRLQEGLANLMQERAMANALDQQMWGRSQAEIDRAMGQQNWLQNFGLQQSQFDWGRLMDEASLTGMYDGNRTLQGQQFDWSKVLGQHGMDLADSEFDWRKIVDQHGMDMSERQLAQQRAAMQAMNAQQQQAYGTSYDQLMQLLEQFRNQQSKPPSMSVPQYQGTLQTSGFRHLFG